MAQVRNYSGSGIVGCELHPRDCLNRRHGGSVRCTVPSVSHTLVRFDALRRYTAGPQRSCRCCHRGVPRTQRTHLRHPE